MTGVLTDRSNATVESIKEGSQARILRVMPDGPKIRYRAGQYGSLGMPSDANPGAMIKRPYSLSSAMIDLATDRLIDPQDMPSYEFYINRIQAPARGREALTPKLFALQPGDRLFCGTKNVGFYTLEHVPPERDLLLISSLTGESANNALAAQRLRHGRGRVGHLLLGPPGWRSLYAQEHDRLAARAPAYRVQHRVWDGDDEGLRELLGPLLADAPAARAAWGFALRPETCTVFLCGDPRMIGAPIKQGAWQYAQPAYGLIRLLTARGFELGTRFKRGTIEYEAYW